MNDIDTVSQSHENAEEEISDSYENVEEEISDSYKNVEEEISDSYKNIYRKKTSPKLNVPSFTYDDKTITVTHDMTLHIHIPNSIDFQTSLSNNYSYLFELDHIIFTKLISNVPDALTFKLYTLRIPSCNIPDEFVRNAFEILKPLIFKSREIMCKYNQYYADDNGFFNL